MKNWNTPELKELDVQLTAKGRGTTEQYAQFGANGWQTATYDVTVGDPSTPEWCRS